MRLLVPALLLLFAWAEPCFAASPGAAVAAGPLEVGPSVADYLVVVPAGGDAAAVAAALRKAATTRLASGKAGGGSAQGELEARVEIVSFTSTYNLAFLKYFGVGLQDADVAGLGAAKDAVRLSVSGPPGSMAAQHVGAELARAAAASAGGWVVDQWTAQAWTPTSFASARPPDFAADTYTLTVVHLVREDSGEALFLESFGLSRFGLPELYIGGIPSVAADDVNLLLCAAAQALVDHPTLAQSGTLPVTLSTLRTGGWPARVAGVPGAGGTGAITFGLRWSHGDPGDDPGAPLRIELVLPGEGDTAARALAARATLQAVREEVIGAAADDAELLAARDRARTAFAALSERFADGIPVGERLLVKSAFPTDEGAVEWMWVEATAVARGTIRGVLLNEPYGRMSVRAGDRVRVAAAEIFDYTWTKADGSVEGGETQRILEAR